MPPASSIIDTLRFEESIPRTSFRPRGTRELKLTLMDSNLSPSHLGLMAPNGLFKLWVLGFIQFEAVN